MTTPHPRAGGVSTEPSNHVIRRARCLRWVDTLHAQRGRNGKQHTSIGLQCWKAWKATLVASERGGGVLRRLAAGVPGTPPRT